MMLMSLVIVPIGIATVVFWIWALVDCLLRPEESYEKMFGTINPKLVWALIIFFGQLIGVIVYLFVAGTRKNPKRASLKVDSAGTEEGKRILQMIADGKISPEEGQRLLVALCEKKTNEAVLQQTKRMEISDQIMTAPGSIWSLVLGVLGICLCGPFTSIPAIICGHRSLSKINKSSGTLTGSGMATAGLVLGYVGIAIMFLVMLAFIPALMQARMRAQEQKCINNLSMIEMAKFHYSCETGRANGWTFTNDKEAFSTLNSLGYIKKYPSCPASTNTEAKGTIERAVADYDVNAVGKNASCASGITGSDAHVLPPSIQFP